jgi:hypothetical protein
MFIRLTKTDNSEIHINTDYIVWIVKLPKAGIGGGVGSCIYTTTGCVNVVEPPDLIRSKIPN